MSQFKLYQKLTNRDLDIMIVLWNSEKSLTASEIVSANPNLNMNTVQAVVRKLLKNKFIKVADIVYSGTVLSRSYAPTISERDFALFKLTSEYQQLGKDLSKTSLISALLGSDSSKDEIDQLKEMLENYKKEISE